jgi:hypothetical protein
MQNLHLLEQHKTNDDNDDEDDEAHQCRDQVWIFLSHEMVNGEGDIQSIDAVEDETNIAMF